MAVSSSVHVGIRIGCPRIKDAMPVSDTTNQSSDCSPRRPYHIMTCIQVLRFQLSLKSSILFQQDNMLWTMLLHPRWLVTSLPVTTPMLTFQTLFSLQFSTSKLVSQSFQSGELSVCVPCPIVIWNHFPATKLWLHRQDKTIIQMLTTILRLFPRTKCICAIHGTDPKTGDEQTGSCPI